MHKIALPLYKIQLDFFLSHSNLVAISDTGYFESDSDAAWYFWMVCGSSIARGSKYVVVVGDEGPMNSLDRRDGTSSWQCGERDLGCGRGTTRSDYCLRGTCLICRTACAYSGAVIYREL